MSSTGFVGFGFDYASSEGHETETMSPEARSEFVRWITADIERAGGTVLFTGEGIGQWEGATEPAGSITFQLPLGEEITARKAELRSALAVAAWMFDQEAIALTFGDTQLMLGADCDYID